MYLSARPNARRLALFVFVCLLSQICFAQIATGSITGRLQDSEGEPLKAAIEISSELGFRLTLNTDARGRFRLTLPYGRYDLSIRESRTPPISALSIEVEPLEEQSIVL